MHMVYLWLQFRTQRDHLESAQSKADGTDNYQMITKVLLQGRNATLSHTLSIERQPIVLKDDTNQSISNTDTVPF